MRAFAKDSHPDESTTQPCAAENPAIASGLPSKPPAACRAEVVQRRDPIAELGLADFAFMQGSHLSDGGAVAFYRQAVAEGAGHLQAMVVLVTRLTAKPW